MRLLALDTSTEGCSAALLTPAGLIGRFEELGRGHAERILGMVDAVLGEAQLSLSMLDGIVAGIGPGAFTGVRISVAAAQGLAFGADLPVVGISTLEALAFAALGGASGGGGRALACLDARMGEVYWACFGADVVRGLRELSVPTVGRAAEVRLAAEDGGNGDGGRDDDVGGHGALGRGYRGIGRGFAAYPEIARLPGLALAPEDSRALPDARDMARLGALRFAAGEGRDAAELRPQYLRDKVAFTEKERAAMAAEASSHGTVT
jgi:tRNA threonylcarbamoyladenosine biosynthesis protein TsaB